ncbi:MAG TPA: hypothetical protein VMU33_10740 [Burkholderiaceae bacterium]|nr:hypothetical protein [Burkholderiaceae bacterium]
MIDRDHTLPIIRHAKVVGIRRGTDCDHMVPIPDSDLRRIRRVDEVHCRLPKPMPPISGNWRRRPHRLLGARDHDFSQFVSSIDEFPNILSPVSLAHYVLDFSAFGGHVPRLSSKPSCHPRARQEERP